MGSQHPDTMSATLFRETSAQRFSRESKEMWEKVQTEENFNNITRASTQNGISDETPIEQKEHDTEALKPVKKIKTTPVPAQKVAEDIFPRKVKSKLVKIKPAIWETNEEN